jgi:hypothetical protein
MDYSVDLNRQPREIFSLSSDALERWYGSPTPGAILAHNANRAVFYTIDAMCLRAFDPERYAEMVAAGAVDVCRESAWIYQDLQQIGNSVATNLRESDSDDITNELFKIANDRLNMVDDWPLPEHLARIPGFPRKDAILTAFELKKAARRARNAHPSGSREHEAAQLEYRAFGEDIEQMVEMSGAEHYYFLHWMHRREEAVDLLYRCDDWIDRSSLIVANDLLLVLHLMYKGRI